MKIYHNPRCSKSRQTLQLIEASGTTPEIIKYLDTPPSVGELEKIVDMLGISVQDLIRKKEAIFIAEFKGKDLSDAEWLQVLADHPKLIERPIVVKGNKAVIGRPPENVSALL